MRYDKLSLLEKLSKRWRGNVVGLWKCDCGNIKEIPITRVKSGHAKSCGCLKLKHGGAVNNEKTKEYQAWQAMHARCNATKGRDAKNYRDRGIIVCERWSLFEYFLSDMGSCPEKHSLDRLDNNKGYFPENCHWATAKQQVCNRQDSVIWHIKGLEFESLRDAGKHFGVNSKTIHYWAKTKKEDCYVVRKY